MRMHDDPYLFCPRCASSLEPFHDGDRLRKRCPRCSWMHYRNPTVGVAVVLITEEGLWLGRRRSGGWCIPCGHVEWDETLEQAAKREAKEEMGIDVELGEVLAVFSNFHDPQQHTVGVWFRSYAPEIHHARPGGDLDDLRPFPLDSIPDLAFPTDREVIESLRNT